MESFSPMLLASIVGWIGMALVLFAYIHREHLSDTRYNIANFVGSIFIIVICLVTEAWPPLAPNIIWAGVAVWRLVKKPAGGATTQS